MEKITKEGYAKNLIFSYLPLLTSILSFIIVTPLLLSNLGKQDFGLYLVVSSIFSYLSLCNLGLPQTVIRKLSTNEKNKILSDNELVIVISCFFYFILISMFSYGVILILSKIFSLNESFYYLKILSFSLFFKLGFELLDAISKSRNNYYVGRIFNAINMMLTSLLIILSVSNGNGITSVFIIITICNFLLFVSYFLHVNKVYAINYGRKYVSWFVFKELVPSSFWYMMGGVGSIIIFQIDNVIIASVLGASSVALFGILFKVGDIIRQVLASMSNIMFTKIAYSKMENEKLLKQHNNLIAITFSIALFSIFLLWLFGFDLIFFWIGIDSSNVSFLLMVSIALYIIIFSLNHVTSVYLSALNLHKKAVIVGYLQAILNISMSVIMLNITSKPEWSLISTILAMLMTNFWYNLYLLNKRLR